MRRMVSRVAWSGGWMSATRPGLEPLAEAFLEGDEFAGQAVAGQDELPAGLVERVEGVKELLLGPGLAGEKLDVVDQEHVGIAVGALEVARATGSRAP